MSIYSSLKISTTHNVKSVIKKQLKEKVDALVGIKLPQKPKQGWIRTIREALDMSGAQLGEKLGMSRNKISILERKEADGNITIAQLELLASGLDCEFVYAIVPKKTVDETVDARVEEIVKSIMNSSYQNMFLEAQQISAEKQDEAAKLLKDELKAAGGKSLWHTILTDKYKLL